MAREFINEDEKKAYLAEFWETLEPMIDKLVMRDRPMGTSFKIEAGVPSDRLGQKRIYTITSRNKMIKFSVDISPWLWTDASVKLQFQLEDAKNLVIPRRKIERKKPDSSIWRPGASTYWFVDTFTPMRNYMKAISLSPVDVGLFSNLEAAVQNLFDK